MAKVDTAKRERASDGMKPQLEGLKKITKMSVFWGSRALQEQMAGCTVILMQAVATAGPF